MLQSQSLIVLGGNKQDCTQSAKSCSFREQRLIVMESFLFFLALLCVSVPASSSPSDRCASDEECRDITTCGEKRFFVQKNQVEIGKLKVCGTEAGTVD